MHPSVQLNLLLGVNRRLWQPRLASQSSPRLALCVAGLLAGATWWAAISACNPTLPLALSLTRLVNALAASPALACLVFVSLAMRRSLAFTWAVLFVLYEGTTRTLAAKGRLVASPTPQATPRPFFLAQPSTDVRHLVLARSAFRFSRGLAAPDLRPAPESFLPVSTPEPLAALPASRLDWIRISQLTGSNAASS